MAAQDLSLGRLTQKHGLAAGTPATCLSSHSPCPQGGALEVPHNCSPGTSGGAEVQGHSQLLSKFKASLGNLRSCLKIKYVWVARWSHGSRRLPPKPDDLSSTPGAHIVGEN